MYCPECGTQNDSSAWKCVQCGRVMPREAAAPVQPPAESVPPPPAPPPAPGGFAASPPPAPPLPPRVPSYLALSIFTTICCCAPIGVAAVVYASRVDPRLAAGDVEGARSHSKDALMWAIIALVIGLIYQIASFLFLGFFRDSLGF